MSTGQIISFYSICFPLSPCSTSASAINKPIPAWPAGGSITAALAIAKQLTHLQGDMQSKVWLGMIDKAWLLAVLRGHWNLVHKQCNPLSKTIHKYNISLGLPDLRLISSWVEAWDSNSSHCSVRPIAWSQIDAMRYYFINASLQTIYAQLSNSVLGRNYIAKGSLSQRSCDKSIICAPKQWSIWETKTLESSPSLPRSRRLAFLLSPHYSGIDNGKLCKTNTTICFTGLNCRP